MSDLDFAAGKDKAAGYDPFFDGAEEAGLGDRQSGFQAIPRGEKLVMKVVASGSRASTKSDAVAPTVQVEVIEGGPEHIGRKSGTINLLNWLVCKREDKDGNVLDDAKFAAKREKFINRVNRVIHAFGLTGYPASMTDADAVEAWMKPAEGAEFVGDLRVETSEFGEGNALVEQSLARLDDVVEVEGKKGQPKRKMTALEESREYHKGRAERAANKGKGKTLGAKKVTGPGGF